MTKLNVIELKTLAAKSSTAQNIFRSLASRNRNRSETDLRQFRSKMAKDGLITKPEEFYEVFKALDKEGMGKLLKSRRGMPRRFAWKVPPKTVGSEVVSLVKRSLDRRQSKPISDPGVSNKTFVLQLDNQSYLEIPGDLSPSDKERISSLLGRI